MRTKKAPQRYASGCQIDHHDKIMSKAESQEHAQRPVSVPQMPQSLNINTAEATVNQYSEQHGVDPHTFSDSGDAPTNDIQKADQHVDTLERSNHDQHSKLNTTARGEEDISEGNNVGNVNYEKQSTRKRNFEDDEEIRGNTGMTFKNNEAAPAKKKTRSAASGVINSIWKYQVPTPEERATAKRNQRDESKFTVALVLADGSTESHHYKAQRQAEFDWSNLGNVVALNKWRNQIFSRANLILGDPMSRWTVEEEEVLRRIVRRAMKTARRSCYLNWLKVNSKFWSIMQTKKKLKGMEFAMTTRSARYKAGIAAAKKAAEQAAGQDSTGVNSAESPAEEASLAVCAEKDENINAGDNDENSESAQLREEREIRTAIKEAAREAKWERRGRAPPPKKSKKSKSVKDTHQDKEKASGRRTQSHLVIMDSNYVSRNASAVERQAAVLPSIKEEMERYKNGIPDDGDSDEDSGAEYSCGDEVPNSDSSDSGLEESDDSLESKDRSNHDDEDDEQIPAGSGLERTYVSCS